MTPVKYLCQILVFLGLTLSVWGDEILFSDSTDYNPIQVSGNWSSPEVWDGGIILGTSPADSELDIVIPYGTKLILDADVELGTITVHGTLAIANTAVHLICDSLIIEGVGAELEIDTVFSCQFFDRSARNELADLTWNLISRSRLRKATS